MPIRYTCWSTLVAAHRLRVIPPGFLIRVFFCTVRAHRKLFHTCAFPVIRQSIQNRKPWSTAGAVDKRMQIPSVFRVKHFFLALIADCNIRGNKDFPFCFFTFDNVKMFKLFCCICGDILCIYLHGAGYGSRTRLNGLGSRCNTDIPTLRFTYRVIVAYRRRFCNRKLCRKGMNVLSRRIPIEKSLEGTL